MNRFGKERKNIFIMIGPKLLFLIFLVIFCGFLVGISNLNSNTKEKQMESLKTAVQRSIVQCYAVEGTYPPSLDYLKEHYGLTYDEDSFFIDYLSIGANIMPDVVILEED
jgi:hypothetical protein